MSVKNLTRAEARHRSDTLTVHSYRVCLDLREAEDTEQPLFDVTTQICLTCSVERTFLDLAGAGGVSVVLNGVDAPVAYDGDRLEITGLTPGGTDTLVVTARLPYSRTGEGLHRFVDPADGRTYLYTQFEPADAHRVYPCFDQPDLKAPISFEVSAPAAWTVISNQPEESAEERPDGARRHVFGATPPLSTYISAVVAGPYVRHSSEWTGADGSRIELGLVCRASLEPHLDDEELFTVTRQGLDFYHSQFGYPYPWGKYDQVFVPEYNLGAMENPGCVTFTESYLHRERATRAELAGRGNTILHEMAHMWFGDLVTPAWFGDLWLKESFAEFMGAHASVEATRYTDAWTTFALGRKAWAYTADQLSTSHPIVADVPDLEAAKQNFDGVTYSKGAAVLKQLVHHVGLDAFMAGARSYFQDLAFSSATLDDLLRHLSAAGGRDLSGWARAWLRTTGPDLLIPEVLVDDGRITELTVIRDARSSSASRPATRPHTLDIGLYRLQGDALVRTELIGVDVNSPRTPVKAARGLPAPDLVLVNDEDLSYAKVRLDSTGTATALAHLSGLAEPLARALVWSMLWNAVRDAVLPVGDHLAAVAAHAGAETDPAILQVVLRSARQEVDQYLPARAVPAARAELAAAAWRGLDAAEPGSDVQLVWARHAALAGAGDPGSAGRLRGLLDGTTPVEGLEVGADLRWSLWQSLAGLGAADVDELDAELGRDRTKNGVAHHLHALVAMPGSAARQEMWRQLRTPGALSNEHVDAVLAGLASPLGRDELTTLNAGYFDELDEVWENHSVEIAQRLVEGLFPTEDPAKSAASADSWLAGHHNAAPGLKRLIAEQRDLASRAATVRAFNAGR